MMTQASWEGFGFLPLWALTLPWSGIAVWWFSSHSGLANHNFAGSGINPTFLINFIVFNLLAGSANSGILYVLLKRWKGKRAEEANFNSVLAHGVQPLYAYTFSGTPRWRG